MHCSWFFFFLVDCVIGCFQFPLTTILQIALNKPSGLQVLPGGVFQQRTVLTQLQWWSNKQRSSVLEELHPVPVHRLGRGTSG